MKLRRSGVFFYVLATLLVGTQTSSKAFARDSKFLSWGVDSNQSPASINLEPALKLYKKMKDPKKEIVVAVVDTGVEYEHPFLKDNLYFPTGKVGKSKFGYDFSKNGDISTTPDDLHGHGTHVAGIIKSVFPEVKLLVLKYYNPLASGQENLASTIRALRFAVDSDVDIINYSGGGPEPSTEEKRILKTAMEKGILVVAAAGNEKSDIDVRKNAYYPASYGMNNIITVTAHNKTGESLPSSNWGQRSIDLSAPGNRIKSSIPSSRAGYMTGTSQATAFATGVAALIKSRFPDLSAASIRNILKKSISKSPLLKKKCSSGGRLNAHSALVLAQSTARKLKANPRVAKSKNSKKKGQRDIAVKKDKKKATKKKEGKIIFLRSKK